MQIIKAGNRDIDPRVFLIFDDCLHDNTWKKEKGMRSVFMNGRHFKIFFILTMQYVLGIPPNLRTNIDFTFILRENNQSNRRRLYEHYAGIFPSFPIFCAVLDQCTENYECLVIDNTTKSNRLEDQVYWYKAEERPNFRLCHNELWEISAEQCREDADEEVEESVEEYYANNNRQPNLHVYKND